MSYISEFHGTDHRSRVMMIIGMFFSLATISLPAIAWFVIPKAWTLQIGTLVCKYWSCYNTIGRVLLHKMFYLKHSNRGKYFWQYVGVQVWSVGWRSFFSLNLQNFWCRRDEMKRHYRCFKRYSKLILADQQRIIR